MPVVFDPEVAKAEIKRLIEEAETDVARTDQQFEGLYDPGFPLRRPMPLFGRGYSAHYVTIGPSARRPGMRERFQAEHGPRSLLERGCQFSDPPRSGVEIINRARRCSMPALK